MNWKQLPQSSLYEMNQILSHLKAHDESTFQHCQRVGEMSSFLAKVAGLPSEEQLLAHVAGLLHDVGKSLIPLEVLNKPGPLTNDEYELMKNHALFSAELIEPLATDEFFKEVQQAVLHHHERVDGKGYPFALENFEIPYIAKIILIVDTVDAMTRSRAYRKGLPLSVVYRELEKFSGQQFDADLVQLFIPAHQELMSRGQTGVILPLFKRAKAA